MSLMGDVQKFIESHPGCTSSDIANAFADFPRKSVLQSTSKLRQCRRVAHRFEGKTRRHFALETDIQPDREPDIGTKPVRSCYVGTNDPQVIMHLIRQAETLESGGLFRRAATVWMEAFRESHIPSERSAFLARRERCLRKSRKYVASGSEWYLSGNYVGS
ncbi:TPA: PerC family transcriptional regulator [Salmonella enterica subsp. enterica serovar Heidelberg]